MKKHFKCGEKPFQKRVEDMVKNLEALFKQEDSWTTKETIFCVVFCIVIGLILIYTEYSVVNWYSDTSDSQFEQCCCACDTKNLASERFSTNFSKDLSKKYQSTVGGFAGTFGGVKQWLYFPKTEHLYFSWHFCFWCLMWPKMLLCSHVFLNKLTIHCVCWEYFCVKTQELPSPLVTNRLEMS